MTRDELFQRMLRFFWLRPENALKSTIRADAFRTTVDLMGTGSDSVDVSCGDGVYSFLALGGELSDSTDMFRSVKTDEVIRTGDYDAFDYFDESHYQVDVKTPAPIAYQYGTDWKPNLLRKAAKLDFYDQLTEHDNNRPLPFETDSMQFVSNNSAYWVERFDFHIADMVRIVRPGGHVVLEMKTREIERYSSRHYASFMSERFHTIIDAGRAETWKGLPTRSQLDEILAGLDSVVVERVDPVFGGLPEMIWDTGLRPLFNPLVLLANGVKEDTRQQAKEEWCQIIYELLTDLVTDYTVTEDEAVEYLIVLKKL